MFTVCPDQVKNAYLKDTKEGKVFTIPAGSAKGFSIPRPPVK